MRAKVVTPLKPRLALDLPSAESAGNAQNDSQSAKGCAHEAAGCKPQPGGVRVEDVVFRDIEAVDVQAGRPMGTFDCNNDAAFGCRNISLERVGVFYDAAKTQPAAPLECHNVYGRAADATPPAECLHGPLPPSAITLEVPTRVDGRASGRFWFPNSITATVGVVLLRVSVHGRVQGARRHEQRRPVRAAEAAARRRCGDPHATRRRRGTRWGHGRRLGRPATNGPGGAGKP